MNILQKVVTIWPKGEDFSALNLIVETGGKGIFCYWHGKKASDAEGLVIYDGGTEATTEEILREFEEFFKTPVFGKKHNSVRVFLRPEETLLIPADYYSSSAAAASLDLVFGDVSGRVVKTEDLDAKAVKICYRIPKELQDLLTAKFPAGGFRHSGACLPERKKEIRDYLFDCIFSPGDFFITVYLPGQLGMMQQFQYRSPADAAYFLLAICHHNKIKPESVMLRLSGTVDRESNLFNELYKYFLKIEWAGDAATASGNEDMSETPPHYFDHLVSLASCAS